MFNESIIIDIYEKVLQDKNTSPEYNRLRRKCIEQRDKFETNLTEEQRKNSENYITIMNDNIDKFKRELLK